MKYHTLIIIKGRNENWVGIYDTLKEADSLVDSYLSSPDTIYYKITAYDNGGHFLELIEDGHVIEGERLGNETYRRS